MRRVLKHKHCPNCGVVSYTTSTTCHLCQNTLQTVITKINTVATDNRLGTQFVREYPQLQLDRGCPACASIIARLNIGIFSKEQIAKEIVNNSDRAGLRTLGKTRQEQKQIIIGFLQKMQTELSHSQSLTKSPWAVGITTAPREQPTLEASLSSLSQAGWEYTRIFADDCDVPPGYPATIRKPAAGAFSNWWLGLSELVQRQPSATWYAMFQDDIVLCKNVRQYLESIKWSGIFSLYQSVHHRSPTTKEYTGGRGFVGALGLVFDQVTAHKLVSSNLGITHRLRRTRQNDWIDGAIGEWAKKNNVPLWIHGPSLIQHTGITSTLGHSEASTQEFLGEDFDATQLIIPKLRTQHQLTRIGLVGYNTAQGLGYINRSIAKWLDIHDWLITKHPRFEMLDRPKVQHKIIDGTDEELQEALSNLDTILFVELCPPNLPRIAQSLGVKTVCVPMVEWLSLNDTWTQHIDLWLAPTLDAYNQLITRQVRGEVKYVPWPIDPSQFQFRQRHTLNKFVFAHGNGGYKDRKGGKLLAEAAKLVPHIPLLVYSQTNKSSRAEPVVWPAHVEVRGSVTTPAKLYLEGDCMILPSRWEGLGLQLYECQAAGMPLITTGAPPMVEANPWKTMPPTPGRVRLTHDIPCWSVAPKDIAAAMERTFQTDISKASLVARDWIETHRNWSVLAPRIKSLL